MKPIERYLPWSIRILIAGLFLVSAYGKIYPDPSAYGTISMFEIKQLYPMGFSVELAKIFSRALIGVEFGLGQGKQRPEEGGREELATALLAVQVNVEQVAGVELGLIPRSAVRDDPEAVEGLAVRMLGGLESQTG